MLHLHLMLFFSQMILLGKGSDLPGSHYFVKKKNLMGFHHLVFSQGIIQCDTLKGFKL
jgi:hypothetical protein